MPIHCKIEDKPLWWTTFTGVDGIDDDVRDRIVDFMRVQEFCLLAPEFGSGGNFHMHALHTICGSQGTSNVRKKIVRAVYCSDVAPHARALVIEAVTRDVPKVVWYVQKECGVEGLLVNTGFAASWITDHVKKNLKRPKKYVDELIKVPVINVPEQIRYFCDMENIQFPRCKTEFLNVMVAMNHMNYVTKSWIKDLPWIMSFVLKDDDISRTLFENALRFIG